MATDSSKNKSCDYNNFKRTRYFHGMLMTDRDFREEQMYLNEKRKLQNRMLHGWGVACGLKIIPTKPESRKIIIEPGLALDCAGNEIFVCEPYELDVIEILKTCTTLQKRPTTAEECEEREKASQNKWYVVIKYIEAPTDPVPVYAPSGGCEEKVCEYSRIREGYCIELHKTAQCPELLSGRDRPCKTLEDENDIREFLCEKLLMPCPKNCCDEQGVVLGSITFKEQITRETTITTDKINNWECRKYAISFGLLQYWMSQLDPQKLPLDAIVNYTKFGSACEDVQSAVQAFEDICDRRMKTLADLPQRIIKLINKSANGITMKAISEQLQIDTTIIKPQLESLLQKESISLSRGKYFPPGK